MKKRFITALLLLVMALTGCSQTETQDSQLPDGGQFSGENPGAVQQPTEAPAPSSIYYVTDHGTPVAETVSSFLAELAENGYVVETDALAALPSDADAVILNAPEEDITYDELAILDSYMDAGGHVLLLLPADEREMRYKNLEMFLEEYCLTMDYDKIEETQKQRIYKDDADYIQMSEVAVPDYMNVPEMTIPAFQRNARSFGMFVDDHYGGLRQDVMLQTDVSAVGVPCGGTEDDPETYEGIELATMVFSRDNRRANSTVIAVGSADFLLDESYAAETSVRMKELVFASLEWLVLYAKKLP